MGDACHIPVNGPTEPDSSHFSSHGPLSAATINIVFMLNNEYNYHNSGQYPPSCLLFINTMFQTPDYVSVFRKNLFRWAQ
jgi:hypothetical protein